MSALKKEEERVMQQFISVGTCCLHIEYMGREI